MKFIYGLYFIAIHNMENFLSEMTCSKKIIFTIGDTSFIFNWSLKNIWCFAAGNNSFWFKRYHSVCVFMENENDYLLPANCPVHILYNTENSSIDSHYFMLEVVSQVFSYFLIFVRRTWDAEANLFCQHIINGLGEVCLYVSELKKN